MRLRDFRRTNAQVLQGFLAGEACDNRRKTVVACKGEWVGSRIAGFFLVVNGEQIAGHDVRFGYVIAGSVDGRHARKIRDQLVAMIDGKLRWAWDD